MEQIKPDNILVSIVNHGLNSQAIQLKQHFGQLCETILIDSGSKISTDEARHFDFIHPNIYYSGLLNKTHEYFSRSSKTVLLFITSDVTIPDCQKLLNRVCEVFTDPNTGGYAPSANFSNHPQMKPNNSNKLKRVTHTDGFCFAVTLEVLDEMCPVDTKINFMGHGLDIYLGYLVMKKGKLSYVDHSVTVQHPLGSGYNGDEAERQRHVWFDHQDDKAKRFHRLALKSTYQNKLGYWFIWWLTRKRS